MGLSMQLRSVQTRSITFKKNRSGSPNRDLYDTGASFLPTVRLWSHNWESRSLFRGSINATLRCTTINTSFFRGVNNEVMLISFPVGFSSSQLIWRFDLNSNWLLQTAGSRTLVALACSFWVLITKCNSQFSCWLSSLPTFSLLKFHTCAVN